MSIKIFCDKCDSEVSEKEKVTMKAFVTDGLLDKFEVCRKCFKKISPKKNATAKNTDNKNS